MKEFAQWKSEFGQFKDDESRRQEFFAELVRTLYKERRFVGVGCSVDLTAFAGLPKTCKEAFRK